MELLRLLCVALIGYLSLVQVDGAITPEQMEKTAKGLRNACQNKISVDTALIDGMRKGEYPDDANLKCYTHCIMKMIRTFKNGKVDTDMTQKQIEIMMTPEIGERMIKAAKTCGGLTGADDCDTAYVYTKCVYDEDPEVFFFP